LSCNSLTEACVAVWQGVPAINADSSQGLVVLLEPNAGVRDALITLLRGNNWRVVLVENLKTLVETASEQEVTAVVSEAELPGQSAEELLETCLNREIPLIFTGHEQQVQNAVDLIRMGAEDYLQKPFQRDRLLDLLNQLRKRHNSG